MNGNRSKYTYTPTYGMQKKGMLLTLMDSSLHILNERYYDNQIGVKEGNDLCSTLIL